MVLYVGETLLIIRKFKLPKKRAIRITTGSRNKTSYRNLCTYLGDFALNHSTFRTQMECGLF
jgi:hypothetical protein